MSKQAQPHHLKRIYSSCWHTAFRACSLLAAGDHVSMCPVKQLKSTNRQDHVHTAIAVCIRWMSRCCPELPMPSSRDGSSANRTQCFHDRACKALQTRLLRMVDVLQPQLLGCMCRCAACTKPRPESGRHAGHMRQHQTQLPCTTENSQTRVTCACTAVKGLLPLYYCHTTAGLQPPAMRAVGTHAHRER